MDDVFKGRRKLFMGFPRYDTQDTNSEIFQEVERATSVRFQDLAQFSDMNKKLLHGSRIFCVPVPSFGLLDFLITQNEPFTMRAKLNSSFFMLVCLRA